MCMCVCVMGICVFCAWEKEVMMRWETWWVSEAEGEGLKWKRDREGWGDSVKTALGSIKKWQSVYVKLFIPNPSFISCLLSVYLSTQCVKCHWTAYMCWLQSERNVKHVKLLTYLTSCVDVCYISQYTCHGPARLEACFHAAGMRTSSIFTVTYGFMVSLIVLFNLFYLSLMFSCRFLVYVCTSSDWLTATLM